MALPVLAICDTDLAYLDRLYEAMIQKQDFIFTIRLYTGVERLQRDGVDDIAVLVVDEALHASELEKVPINTYIVLSKEKTVDNTRPTVHKYCKTERLIQQIYERYYESSNCIITKRNHNTKIIGLYSPIKRCYQTSFAVTLGQVLAQHQKVLYVNLEGYAAVHTLFEDTYSYQLTDIIYLLQNMPDKLPLKIDSMVEHVNGLEFLPPCKSDLDIRGLEVDDLCQLLETLAVLKTYEYIILDLSDCLSRVYELLQMCDVIYTITADDELAQAKIKGYEDTIMTLNYSSILQKTKKLRIPSFKSTPTHISQLLYSELAEYVKKIREEEDDDKVSNH